MNNITKNWICEYTGLDFHNVTDFDIENGILKVEVYRLGDDWLPDFMVNTEKKILAYRDGGYTRPAAIYFELPMPEDITSDGKADFESLSNKAGGEHIPVIYWSEKLAMERQQRINEINEKNMREWEESFFDSHRRTLSAAGDL
jgi:hypothetical protein